MNVIDLVLRHEGFRAQVYCDQCGEPLVKTATEWRCRCFHLNRTPGNITVGIGTRVDGAGITMLEARAVVFQRISRLGAEIGEARVLARLDQARLAAMLDMAYNLGAHGLLEFTEMIACLEKHDFDGAADAVLHSKWASQVPARAADCAFMLRTGVFPFDEQQGAQA